MAATLRENSSIGNNDLKCLFDQNCNLKLVAESITPCNKTTKLKKTQNKAQEMMFNSVKVDSKRFRKTTGR